MKIKMLKKNAALAILLYVLLLPHSVNAAAKSLLGTAPDTGAGADGLTGTIEKIVTGFVTLTAVVAIIFVIIGGLQYLTSTGDEKKAAAAKSTILYAIIGVVIIALAGAIVNFVINQI